jgi:hypothetical protein
MKIFYSRDVCGDCFFKGRLLTGDDREYNKCVSFWYKSNDNNNTLDIFSGLLCVCVLANQIHTKREQDKLFSEGAQP